MAELMVGYPKTTVRFVAFTDDRNWRRYELRCPHQTCATVMPPGASTITRTFELGRLAGMWLREGCKGCYLSEDVLRTLERAANVQPVERS